jgi:hypothetical protein
MQVNMNIYGAQAKVLAHELGLACSNKTAKVDMTALFSFRDVEGQIVVQIQFTSRVDVEGHTIISENNRTKDEQEFLDASRAYCKRRKAVAEPALNLEEVV